MHPRKAATLLGLASFGGACILGAVKSGPATLGATLAWFLTAVVLITSGQLRRKASLLMLSAGAVLALFLSVRTSPWLVSLDVIMIIVLSIGAASYNRLGNVWGPMSTILRRVVRAVIFVSVGASEVVTTVASMLPTTAKQTPDRKAAAGSKRRGVIVAAPLLLVMLALFASADPVFASYAHLPTVSSNSFNDLAIAFLGAVSILGLTRLAKTPISDPTLKTKVTSSELSIVLGGFVMIYSAFAFTQIVATIGGATYVQERTGGSYKEYARSGFFQLLIASAITLILLFIARGPLERSKAAQARQVQVLSLILCIHDKRLCN
jgi:Domain of unknown function (DUF4173)